MSAEESSRPTIGLTTIIREWARLGCLGFGGPPTHIAMLRALCVEERGWITEHDFEDGIATTNLLPGPASTQLAIYCAWRLGGVPGGIVGGICFIIPGLVMILVLSAVFLAKIPPTWILGAAAGAGAAVPAVALSAAWSLVASSRARMGDRRAETVRWILYGTAGALVAATIGTYLVLVIVACGLIEVQIRGHGSRKPPRSLPSFSPLPLLAVAAIGSLGSIAWVAFKVGALSYGGGFVIIPLMQHDVVTTYHWMTGAQFLNAVALGQITPGPVVQTVAVVGYAAGGIGGGLLASAIAFGPSFVFVLLGARHFEQIRSNARVRSFLTGAGPTVIGAIAGSAVPLGLSLSRLWQIPVLLAAGVWLLAARRGVVSCLLAAGAIGAIVAICGVSV